MRRCNAVKPQYSVRPIMSVPVRIATLVTAAVLGVLLFGSPAFGTVSDEEADDVLTEQVEPQNTVPVPFNSEGENEGQHEGNSDREADGVVGEDVASAAPLAEQGPHADGWADENGERYYYVAGERVKGSLFVDGGWYRFDLSDGHMLTGWQDIDGKRYFYGDDGAMLFKNQFLGGSWYWFDMNEGFMWTGSANIYGRWYRYDLSDGHMLTGSQYIDGHWYRYEPVEGYMLFGSQYIDGHWYWYDLAAGMMLTGSQYIYGDWYWYDLTEGMMLFGWQDIYGGAYFYDRMDGKMYFGSRKIDGQWRYFNPVNGALDRQEAIRRIMSMARSLLGVPYVWLGVYPEDGGMDCASFVWYLYKQLGINIGFETYFSVHDGYAVSLQDAKPGDLIFMYYSWRGPEHVVLYAGNGMIYEEPDFGGHCQYVSLASKHASDMVVRRIVSD